MALPELRMSFADQGALAAELDNNLRHGRAFLLGAGGVEVLADCVLVLIHPEGGRMFGLRGQVVMVSDSEAYCGIGVQLRPFDPDVLAAIEAFAAGDPDVQGTADVGELRAPTERAERAEDPGVAAQPAAPPNIDGEPTAHEAAADAQPEPMTAAPERADAPAPDLEAAGEDVGGEQAASDEAEPIGDEAVSDDDAELAEDDAQAESEGEGEDEGDELASDRQHQQLRHERIRKLSVTEQHKVARYGELNDRVLLERIYGRQVWEGLLQNPKLTLPEVARIARKGSVPRPLIEQIVENNAWVQSPLVRRALLSNPRISSEGILKLLRMTPRQELKLIYKTTTYPNLVRETARRVLDL